METERPGYERPATFCHAGCHLEPHLHRKSLRAIRHPVALSTSPDLLASSPIGLNVAPSQLSQKEAEYQNVRLGWETASALSTELDCCHVERRQLRSARVDGQRIDKPDWWLVGLVCFTAAYLNWRSWRELAPLWINKPLESPVNTYGGLACAVLLTVAAMRLLYRRLSASRRKVS